MLPAIARCHVAPCAGVCGQWTGFAECVVRVARAHLSSVGCMQSLVAGRADRSCTAVAAGYFQAEAGSAVAEAARVTFVVVEACFPAGTMKSAGMAAPPAPTVPGLLCARSSAARDPSACRLSRVAGRGTYPYVNASRQYTRCTDAAQRLYRYLARRRWFGKAMRKCRP